MSRWNKNIMAKILSLVAAIVLWVYVMGEQNPMVEVNYTVPVRVENLNSNYILENAPESIRVSLRGPRNTILRLDPNTLVSTLNLNNIKVGPHKLPISFNAPMNMSITRQTPAQADVYVDYYTVKEIPVEFQGIGTIPKEYAVKETKLVPSRVAISGAKHRVDAVAKAYIASEIKSIPSDNKVEVKGPIHIISASGAKVEHVSITPNQGSGILEMERTSFDKSISVKPNVVGSPAPGYRVVSVEVTPKQVPISGKSDVINSVNSINTQPIPIDGAKEDVTSTVDIVPQAGIEEPKTLVKVVVHIEQDVTGTTTEHRQ